MLSPPTKQTKKKNQTQSNQKNTNQTNLKPKPTKKTPNKPHQKVLKKINVSRQYYLKKDD